MTDDPADVTRCAGDSMMEARDRAGCAGTDGERAHVMIGAATPLADCSDVAEQIRVRGLVQGVGFRPAVWRLARRHGLRGWVANDGDGVTIRLRGPADAIARFVDSLPAEAPPLARIDRIERTPGAPSPHDAAFHIADSLVTRRTHRRGARRSHLPALPRRGVRRLRTTLSLSVRQLHALRTAAIDHPGDPVRPSRHHHARVRSLPGLRRRVSRSERPPVPRATDCLPRLRPARLARARRWPPVASTHRLAGRRGRRGDLADARADPRHQGARRIPACLRRNQSGRGRATAGAQTAAAQAACADGARSRRRARLLRHHGAGGGLLRSAAAPIVITHAAQRRLRLRAMSRRACARLASCCRTRRCTICCCGGSTARSC